MARGLPRVDAHCKASGAAGLGVQGAGRGGQRKRGGNGAGWEQQIVPPPLRNHQAQDDSRAFVPWSPTPGYRCGTLVCGTWCDASVPQFPLPKLGSLGGSGWMTLSLVKIVGSQWPGGLPLSREQSVPAGVSAEKTQLLTAAS